MCAEAWDSTARRRIASLGDMRGWLGAEPVWFPDAAPGPGARGNGDEYCLCGVDIRACAALRGMSAEFDGIDWVLSA